MLKTICFYIYILNYGYSINYVTCLDIFKENQFIISSKVDVNISIDVRSLFIPDSIPKLSSNFRVSA